MTSDGRIAVHDSAYGECAGSRESRGVIPGRSVRWCWRIYGLIDDLPDL